MSKTLPIAPVEKLLRKAGADRVASSASQTLAAVLEDIGGEISRRASALSVHAGRRTVKVEDVKMAVKEIWG